MILANGRHNVTFFANDTSSNKNQGNKSLFFYVDLSNPQVTSLSCPSSVNDSLDVVCTVNLTDTLGLDYVIFSHNSTGSWENSSQLSLSGTDDGQSYTIDSISTNPGIICVKVYAYDGAGQINVTTTTVTILDDTDPIKIILHMSQIV